MIEVRVTHEVTSALAMDVIDPETATLVELIAWQHRLRITPPLRPRLPPADPIVAAQRGA